MNAYIYLEFLPKPLDPWGNIGQDSH